ncbi:Ribonuclease D [Penicillium camemberti]|uniref:Ribonuclease D n=1 Tax=Penicillium camemberti (strain FM 013) TaxID=1429867 RepID=A0A0G4NU51_PENC3|nr:Ribonuclease D [Penicillium camemberti]
MDSAEFAPFQDKLTSALVQVTRTVGQLSSEDLNFHRTSSAEFSESLDEQSARIIALTSAVIKAATAGTDVTGPTLHDEDSVEDNWRGVVDVIDSLLEKADACLDEFTGVIKKLSPSQEEQAPIKKAPNFPTIYDYGPSKIPKPQLLFNRKPDNTDMGPFKPLLKTKPHAIVPLEKCLKTKKMEGGIGYPHPYETEILASEYPKPVYQVSPPVEYLPFESTTATFVDTLDGVKEMLKELKKAKEIAIDLEHHDVHSYHGLVSLMQISTRDKDWVVDTLQPWREELQMLNEVFADPKILKVLHGSTMDIIWLQRDLGLYVVGMFDTFHAASALGFPKRSLKFLLSKFVNFEADKRYQTADWRARPLPPAMFDYARSDTHYLLYIYDRLRNDLIDNSTEEASHIDYVNERSKHEALQRYERPVYDAVNGHGPGGWYDLLWRNSGNLPKEQFAVFKAVHQWRDEVARAEDEGWQCVFPKHMLFKLATMMPLDMGSLFRTLSPMTPITKERSHDLLEVIKQAKLAGLDGPEWRDVAPPKHLAKVLEAAITEAVNFPIAERYETSQFWGNVLDARESPPPPAYALAASAEALRLSLPLPPMPMTVSETRDHLGTANEPTPAPKPTPTPAPQEPEEKKYFTVKDLGGPRKRKVTPVNNPEQALSIPADLDDTSNDPDSTQKKSKKSRKEKKAKKAKSDSKSESEAPFDYGTADAVLNAPSAATVAHPRKKAFNPYTKAMEAPSGARKTKREIPGKSLTFRQ